ncbi:cytochrome c, mono- and diheme variants family [Schinkia azotoformans MEV2011]|uniref:Cytochrome c-551 n=2 Tax=Schinkia azotoformans TaxID=1454 RepID=K6DHV8_SCHAZ|nr:cytochrome c [Schinkia azotoformans]EKN67698.1 cytochrome c-551 [Schinkia azotoformans LMG 9581]KEF40300.1 cytochrome c, mono- and diheme variants family [Schinkia azotoformans MEV2011]MEC1637532.1 cytochrome c [Schinkia azotoformans]MEC1696392.1 cytochrome c [Schinkia azotoformans]MEC1715562.1 cytochrome c [Schinkia azotoformans]
MKKKLLALFMGSALILGACGGGGDTAKEPADNNAGNGDQTAAPAADNAAAEGLFAQSCASCHGQNLEGGVGPDLTKVGSKLDAAGIEGVITNGQGAMPAGLLQGDDAKAVAEWLATHK